MDWYSFVSAALFYLVPILVVSGTAAILLGFVIINPRLGKTMAWIGLTVGAITFLSTVVIWMLNLLFWHL